MRGGARVLQFPVFERAPDDVPPPARARRPFDVVQFGVAGDQVVLVALGAQAEPLLDLRVPIRCMEFGDAPPLGARIVAQLREWAHEIAYEDRRTASEECDS